MTNSTRCNRNCFNNSQIFNYTSINCYLKQIRQRNKTPLYVVVMTKNNDGSFSYHQKNITYFIPINSNNNISYAYFTASSNDYNYMYLLSKQYSQNVFEGNHFTIGLKNNQVDLHYTYYNYMSPIPKHRYYKGNNKQPSRIVKDICDKRINTESETEHDHRCNFFGTLMKYLHDNDNSCQEGGKKFQVGGDDNDVTPISFNNIESKQRDTLKNLQSVFDTYNELKAIETYIIDRDSGIGLLTFCYNDREYVSFPLDYHNMSFIHINELVKTLNLNTNSKTNTNNTKSIKLVDACLENYGSIEKMFENITKFLNMNNNTKMNCNEIIPTHHLKFPIVTQGGQRKKKNKQ